MLNDDGDRFWKVILVLILLIGLVLFDAFVFVKMWDWFVRPTFSTAPSLNYPTAIGLSLLVSFFQRRKTKNDNEQMLGNLFNAFFDHSLLTLFLAWVTHLFM